MSTESPYPENLVCLNFPTDAELQVATDWLLEREYELQEGWFYSDSEKKEVWPEWIRKAIQEIGYLFCMGIQEGLIKHPYSEMDMNMEKDWDDSSWSFRNVHNEEEEYTRDIIPLDRRWNYREERPYTWRELGLDI